MSNYVQQAKDQAGNLQNQAGDYAQQGKDFVSKQGENLQRQASKASENLPGSNNSSGGVGEQAQNAMNSAKESLGLNK
ncbi:hypothetical protein MOBT1_000851 [Malassezia obtusa]|uniref:Uncharacterized protein n=1 Tax=Malassezia obtusa TaxID=76774 RepID=A0AAF0DZA8_9BASI|nr:hypothetical protein MOBT1_000851 [Malassezia obtusa]